MNQTDPWEIVSSQVFTPCDCLLISVIFVVLYHVGCLWVTGVNLGISIYIYLYFYFLQSLRAYNTIQNKHIYRQDITKHHTVYTSGK